jgi:hypothetical protein
MDDITSRVIRRSLNGEGIHTDQGPSRSAGSQGRSHGAACPSRHRAGRQAPQGQLDAPRKSRRALMAFAWNHYGARLPGVFLKPFRSRPAHIMLLWPIAVRQVPHDYIPRLFELPSGSRVGLEELRISFFGASLGALPASRVNRGCRFNHCCETEGISVCAIEERPLR